MRIAFDHILVARILFTLMTVGWAIATVFADFNKTHATNPKWTPHARFHVVWQISSYVGFGLLAFALIWWPGPLALERLYLVALMGTIGYAAFFAALLAMPVYGGAAYDDKRQRLPAVRGAGAAVREKMGRQHHRLLDPAGDFGGRYIDGHRRFRGLSYSHPLKPSTPAATNIQSGLTRVKNATAAVTAVMSPA